MKVTDIKVLLGEIQKTHFHCHFFVLEVQWLTPEYYNRMYSKYVFTIERFFFSKWLENELKLQYHIYSYRNSCMPYDSTGNFFLKPHSRIFNCNTRRTFDVPTTWGHVLTNHPSSYWEKMTNKNTNPTCDAACCVKFGPAVVNECKTE